MECQRNHIRPKLVLQILTLQILTLQILVLLKIAPLEPACKDCGQAVIYKGGISERKGIFCMR